MKKYIALLMLLFPMVCNAGIKLPTPKIVPHVRVVPRMVPRVVPRVAPHFGGVPRFSHPVVGRFHHNYFDRHLFYPGFVPLHTYLWNDIYWNTYGFSVWDVTDNPLMMEEFTSYQDQENDSQAESDPMETPEVRPIVPPDPLQPYRKAFAAGLETAFWDKHIYVSVTTLGDNDEIIRFEAKSFDKTFKCSNLADNAKTKMKELGFVSYKCNDGSSGSMNLFPLR